MDSKPAQHGNGAASHRRRPQKPLGPMQKHLVAASGEFVGTILFLWLSYSSNMMALSQAPSLAPSGGHSSLTVLIISLGYGFSLLVKVWAFYRISGGLFNPAVSHIYSSEPKTKKHNHKKKNTGY